mgnify:FL=1
MNIKEAAVISDIARARQLGLMPLFEKASAQAGVPKQILMAVASRESRMGDALGSNPEDAFRGDNNNGHGIMQIDIRFHKEFVANHPPNDHEAIINKGAEILANQFASFQNWKYALAAYNTGPSDVNKAIKEDKDPDLFTTGGNYSKDVMRRAKIIEKQVDPAESRFGVIIILLLVGFGLHRFTTL